MILPRTIVRDVYERDKAASFIGYMTTAMMVAPLFGPAFGGWLTDISTWRLLYAILAVLGLLFSFLSFRFLHETLRESDVRPVGSRFFDAARTLLKRRAFNAYLLIQVGSVGVYYAFLGGAPYIMMELRGMSASQYGAWFILIAIGYLSGNLITGKLSSTLGVDRMIGLALVPYLAALPLFWLLSGWQHPLALFLPMQLVALSNGMCMPNVLSASMSVVPALSGSASGLAGTVQTFVGIVFTLTLSLFLRDSPLPLYWLITISGLLTACGYWQVKITETNRKTL